MIEWGNALANSAGAAASKAIGNVFDQASRTIKGENSYLRDYKGKTPPSGVLNYADKGATAYREQVVRTMDKRLLAGKEFAFSLLRMVGNG